MKLNIDIDEEHTETTITIKAKEWTTEIEDIVKVIKSRNQQRLFGIDAEQTVLLDPENIDFIYAEKRKIFAVLADRQVELKLKLYEVEELLTTHHFMRFSKSVIGNLQRIERFELSFNGNLCVFFLSGNKEYITRKHVNAVKEKLMMGGNSNDR